MSLGVPAHYKSWYLGYKLPKKVTTDSPGPGAYEIKDHKSINSILSTKHVRTSSFDNKRSHSFSKRSGQSMPLCYSGLYDWRTNTVDRGIKFPSCVRKLKFSPLKNENPGPGSYTYKNHSFGNKGPYLTLKPKIELKDPKEEIPGPGYYKSDFHSISSKLNHSNSVKAGGLMFGPIVNKMDLSKFLSSKPPPNPWSYSPNAEHLLPTYGQCVIGKSAKSEFLKEVAYKAYEPGPGNYDPKPKSTGPHFSLKSRFKRKDDNGIPGPGEYNIDKLFKKIKRSRIM